MVSYFPFLPPPPHLPSLLRPSTLHFIPRTSPYNEKIPNFFGIFYYFLSFSTILILFFSGPMIKIANLRNCNTFSHHTSRTCGPLPLVMHLIFFNQSGLPFWILSQIQIFRSSSWLISQKLVIRATISISLIVDLPTATFHLLWSSYEIWHSYEGIMTPKLKILHFFLQKTPSHPLHFDNILCPCIELPQCYSS